MTLYLALRMVQRETRKLECTFCTYTSTTQCYLERK